MHPRDFIRTPLDLAVSALTKEVREGVRPARTGTTGGRTGDPA